MNVTPVIPDGYNGPIKQLTCRICKHIFYITQDDYHRLPEIRLCHECSLIVREELEKTQGASTLTPPTVVEEPVVRSPLPSSAASIQSIRLPQPRTIGREKMTVEQLFEEAAMLCKTWRYKEALHSYEDILQRDPHCLKALSGRASMLSTLDRSKEALAVYEEIVRLEPDSAQAYSDKGENLMELRRYDEALAAFDTALQLDPSSRQASAGKWFLFTHLHRDEEAERFFPPQTEDSVYQQELTQPCHTAEDYSWRGKILRALGRHEEAIRAYEESLRLDPLHLGVYTDIYTMRFKKDCSQKVVTILNQAVQAFPACTRLHIYHAEVLSQLERHQEALEACNRVIESDSTSPAAYREKSRHLHKLKREREALEIIEQAIELDPDSEDAYLIKAEILASLRRDDEALAAYDQAIQIDPDHFHAYGKKVEFLASHHRDEDVLATYDQFIERTPHIFKGYHSKLFFLFIDRKRYTDALATCEQCLVRNPEMVQAHEWKGRTLWYLDRYEEALLSYEEALRLDASNEDLYVGKAGVLASLKRFDEALMVCEQALQFAPAKVSVYKEKASILIKQKRYEEALPAYQKVVQLDPNDACNYEHVGDLLCQLERFADAIKAYNQAIRLSPDFTRVYQSKARALENLGHYEQALATYNKALQLHPKNGHLLFSRAGVLKKLLRYEEANADYLSAEVSAQAGRSDPLLAVCCMLAKVDLKKVAEAKARLQAADKEISDEAIEAEIHLMYEEQKAAEVKASLRSSPLFQPVCLLTQEMQEWSGTAKQFKELLSTRFPNELKTWYRSPSKFVEELKKIAPELQEEGIAVSVPPDTKLVTLTKQREVELP
jgi:tetratricopeptide (TPR) repeat protein